MNKYWLLPLFILSMLSCKPREQSAPQEDGPMANRDSTDRREILPDNPIDIDTITVAEFIAGFKERELREYTTDDINYQGQDLRFYSRKRLLINDSLKEIPISGYPKSLRQMDNGMTRVTTVAGGEVSMKISMYTLDRFYNIIAAEVLTARGGDETTGSEIDGKFLNDSTYSRTEITINYPDHGDATADTLKSHFVIHSNGKIE